MKNFLKISLIFLLSIGPVFGQNIAVFDFTQYEFDNLEKRKVKGETIWTLGSNENGNYIKAEAVASGSGLGKR